MILLGGGKPDEARPALTELVRSDEVYAGTGRLYLATTDLYEGKLGAAVGELENGIRFDQRLRNTQPERKRRYFLSRIALLRGDGRAARSQVDAILTAPLETFEPQELMSTGMVLARMGDVQRARRLLRQLEHVREQVGSGTTRADTRILPAKSRLPRRTTGKPGRRFSPRSVNILALFRRSDWRAPMRREAIGHAPARSGKR